MNTFLLILNIFFVSFVDKPTSTTPSLSPRALEQRAKWDIPIDYLDLPVSSQYTDSLRAMGVKICHTSRWMNGATCQMDEELASKVAQLKFVKQIEQTRNAATPNPLVSNKRKVKRLETKSETSLYSNQAQLDMLNLTPLHKAGHEGQGILMAVCDAGFHNADSAAFLNPSTLELGHFDFTDDTDPFYGAEGGHGLMCLSTITGRTDSYYGTATKAAYYLMRTEELHTESPKEMDNLVVALETADSLGVNVFSVSLGYFYFDNAAWNLTQNMLDGKSNRASQAATIAARKGMLVCASAGNEGESSWHKICVPADADSILTVGAVDGNGIIGAFSSYGYSTDGRVKPDVCAQGVQTAVIDPNGNIIRANGTSFAAPQIAGLAAALWSALPNENAMQIRERIIASADRYNTPDTTQYGYGIPNAWKAYSYFAENEEIIEHTNKHEKPCKMIHRGVLYVLRNGKKYSLLGHRIE